MSAVSVPAMRSTKIDPFDPTSSENSDADAYSAVPLPGAREAVPISVPPPDTIMIQWT